MRLWYTCRCKKQAAIRDKLEKLTELAAVVNDLNLLNEVSSSLDGCIEIMEQSVNLKNAKRAQEEECVAVKKLRKSQPVKSKSYQNRLSLAEREEKAKNGKKFVGINWSLGHQTYVVLQL